MARSRRRKRCPLPDPPPPSAVHFTKDEAAGYLRIRVRGLDELRRDDPTFPRPRLLSSGTARWSRISLDTWLESRPTGWCANGGRRRGAFGVGD